MAMVAILPYVKNIATYLVSAASSLLTTLVSSNVLGHHGYPEAIDKTASLIFRKLRLLNTMRHSPVGYLLALKPSSSIKKIVANRLIRW